MYIPLPTMLEVIEQTDKLIAVELIISSKALEYDERLKVQY